jgi:hypothetical protein
MEKSSVQERADKILSGISSISLTVPPFPKNVIIEGIMTHADHFLFSAEIVGIDIYPACDEEFDINIYFLYYDNALTGKRQLAVLSYSEVDHKPGIWKITDIDPEDETWKKKNEPENKTDHLDSVMIR